MSVLNKRLDVLKKQVSEIEYKLKNVDGNSLGKKDMWQIYKKL